VISKIEGPGSIRKAQPVKRAGKTGSAGSASFSRLLEETSETGAANNVGGTTAVSGILGVQEVDDALAHATKGKTRAQDILDRLEDLRIELLTGTISREKLLQLSRIVTAHKGQVNDPRLAEILAEVDLRARVELAKYAANTPSR
jgi:hypothetical protein